MGRLPRIILWIALFTGLFLLITTAFNSCGKNADDLLDDSTEFVTDTADDASDFLDDADDIFEDDGEDIFVEDVEEDDSDDGYEIEDVDTDYTEPEPDYTSTTTSYSSSSGDYMVIAGNYLVQSNAKGMIRKLSNLGYPSAEIGVFDRSQYHTVIAARSDSYSSAMETSNAIKRQGIDCYVKRKQY